jgi:hypothetical protein
MLGSFFQPPAPIQTLPMVPTPRGLRPSTAALPPSRRGRRGSNAVPLQRTTCTPRPRTLIWPLTSGVYLDVLFHVCSHLTTLL